MDTLQFAYRQKRGVEDEITTLLNRMYKHLELPSSYVHILFVDFSSVFNTIQSHILIEKLKSMAVNDDFLTNRAQYVKAGNCQSSTICTNRGLPQGCVLSPLLYILYTNDCVSQTPECSLIKFAYDTALVGFLTGNEISYRQEIEQFHEWCKANSLILNTLETKKIVINFSNFTGE